MANHNSNTEYWLQPQFKSNSPLVVLRGREKRAGGGLGQSEKPKFSIDFFEQCQALQFSDLEVSQR